MTKPTIYLQELGHPCEENDEYLVRGIITGPIGEATVEWTIEDKQGVIGVISFDFCPFCGLRLPDVAEHAYQMIDKKG